MATSYLATNYRVGDGSTTIWNVSFAGARPDQGDGTEAYLDPDSIQAVRIDTASDGSETETSIMGTLIGPTQYEITPALAEGVRVKIYRETEKQYPLVDFTDFTTISENDLDIQARQTLYSVQELNDVVLYSDKRSVTASLNAQEALDSAQAAQTDVSSAVDTANDAESIANAASSTAGSASTTASQALNTANSADEKADTAISTANSADEKADTAIGTANTALSTANAAETAATNANSSANAAVSTANSADDKADTALSTANAAASDAGAAVMTANAADSKADDALAVASDITDFQGQLDDLSDRVDSLVDVDTGDLLLGSNNLNELSNYATARSNLDVYSTTQVDTAIGQAVSNHAGEADPHPVYALKANLSAAASRPIGNGDTELVTNDRASSLIGNRMSSHESAPDPHPQYLLSEDLPDASTSTPGIVQLESSYTDTGTGTAPTSKALQDGLSNQSNLLNAHKISDDHDDRYYTQSHIDSRVDLGGDWVRTAPSRICYFQAYLVNSQSFSSRGSNPINFNGVSTVRSSPFYVDNDYYNSATFTAPADGLYEFYCKVTRDPSEGDAAATIKFMKNGSVLDSGPTSFAPGDVDAGANTYTRASIHMLIELSAGDTMQVAQTSGSVGLLGGSDRYCFWSGRLL